VLYSDNGQDYEQFVVLFWLTVQQLFPLDFLLDAQSSWQGLLSWIGSVLGCTGILSWFFVTLPFQWTPA
jgi:hypothetical protein